MKQLPVNIPEFVVSFVREMRSDPRISTKPSVRQSHAILDFLLARFLRFKRLTVKDLVHAAVSTTYYDDQKIARELALAQLTKLLNDLIADVEHEPLTNQRLAEVIRINTALQDYTKDEKVLDELFKTDLTNVEDIRDLVDLIFKSRKDQITPEDLKYFQKSEKLEQYQWMLDEKNQKYARSMLDQDGWKQDLLDVAKTNPKEFGEMLKNLRDMGVDSSRLQEVLQAALQETSDYEEYERLLYASALYAPPPPEIFDQISPEKAHDNLKCAQELDKQFYADKSHNTEQMLQNFLDRKIDLNVDDIINSFSDTDFWRDIAQKFFDQKRRSQSSVENMQMTRQIRNTPQSAHNMDLQKFLQTQARQTADYMLEHTTDPKEFMKMAEELRDIGQNFDKTKLQMKAEEFEIDPSQIEPFLCTKTENIKEMIRRNLDDFGQYAQYLQDFDMNAEARLVDMITEGIKHQIPSVIGALGHKNLQITAEIFDKYAKREDIDLLVEGLARGSGMNLLLQWYKTRDTIPAVLKPRLQSLLQSTLLNLAEYHAKVQFGFINKGNIVETQDIRGYVEGDDLESVDIDETINNLIAGGKNPESMTESDLICKKYKEGRIKVMIVLDSSGSMRGEKITMASLASLILLQLLRQQDLSVVVFSGDTHILKHFDDELTVDALSSQLLEIEAKGGTQFGQTLQYIVREVEKLDSGQMMLVFLFSDFAFYEKPRELELGLQKIVHPEFQLHSLSVEYPDEKMLRLFARYLHLTHTDVKSVHELPQILSNLLYHLK
jgi:uncharacterized protein with von Willebrand factor type A (vWA) domain